MSYGGIASSISAKNASIGDVVGNINGLNFEGVWSSTAGQKLLTSLTDVVGKINTEKGNLSTFVGALNKLDELIAKDNRIAELSSQLAGLDPDDEDDAGAIAAINAEISRLQEERRILKEAIVGILGSFGVAAQVYTPITSAGWDDLFEKAKVYNSLPVTHNLFKALTVTDSSGTVIRDGEEYFNSVIASVRSQYSGTEKTYYTTLALVDLCIEAGVRLEYDHAGTGTGGIKTNDRNLRTPVPSSTVSTGTDCNAIASYLVFGDDSAYTKWLSTTEFHSAGEFVEREGAVRGDVFSIHTDERKHVGIIMGYNAETDQYLIYHGSGQAADHNMKIVDGRTFDAQGYVVRRVDSTYKPDWYRETKA